MQVTIAGAHGQIARRLTRSLSQRGDTVVGLIRNPAHIDELVALGARPMVCDLERVAADVLAETVSGSDAVVFAAGAGAGSGAERKLTLDRDGAIKLLEAARAAGVPRYVMISSVGAEDPPDGDDVFSVYLQAKAQADEALMTSDRDWTIVRPGRLTDDPGSGHVRIQSAPFRGEVPRDDVAAVLEAVLHEPRTSGRVLYVNAGDEPVDQALRAALGV
jgi:nucleoside-diphosphate-sugar epimerase